ncbi:MAG: site-specific DNA-methyltransferase [Gemmatimonadetes bacterium]|nr:MAG: site-specific DNA-methyltransferase [Gemmatimonadota bacterium]
MAENVLYYGDNLDVLRRHIKDESVDLVYLDPPFNSNQSYNVLFAEKDGSDAAAQIEAFEDTWHWDQAAAREFQETVERGGKVSEVLQAFRLFLGTNDMLAYLTMMAPRLVDLRRALKETGSLYLHCDPTASHYLKLLLDAVFGPEHFRSEIIWKRSSAHSDTKQGRVIHGHIHDVLLFYTKSDEWTWNPVYTPYDPDYVEQFYKYVEQGTGRRYRLGDLTGPGGAAKGNPSYEVMGVTRYWRYSKEKMNALIKAGRIIQTKPGSVPAYKRYLDEMPGVPLQDLWTDIPPIAAQAAERLGYPTQKPEALLERIILGSSNEGDAVLDPFCGCGTTVAAAQKLRRRWTGIDVTYLAIGLIKTRLRDAYGDDAKYVVIGEPTTVEDAARLAEEEPYQFQAWALGLVGARRAGPIKKGADKGIDGRLYFHDGADKTRQIVISVKAGALHATYVRDLVGVVQREKADIGVLISFEEPTRPMRQEAASADFYTSPWGKHPRIQLLTVADLLAGKGIDYPRTAGTNVTLKAAPRVDVKDADELHLFEDTEVEETPAPKKARKEKRRE